MTDQDIINAWNAETDPAPITEAALREMGWVFNEQHLDWTTPKQLGANLWFNRDRGSDWCLQSHNQGLWRCITTLGELRTLLRLAGEKP